MPKEAETLSTNVEKFSDTEVKLTKNTGEVVGLKSLIKRREFLNFSNANMERAISVSQKTIEKNNTELAELADLISQADDLGVVEEVPVADSVSEAQENTLQSEE